MLSRDLLCMSNVGKRRCATLQCLSAVFACSLTHRSACQQHSYGRASRSHAKPGFLLLLLSVYKLFHFAPSNDGFWAIYPGPENGIFGAPYQLLLMLVWEPEIAILQYKIANSSRGWNGQNGLSRAPGRSHFPPKIQIFSSIF